MRYALSLLLMILVVLTATLRIGIVSSPAAELQRIKAEELKRLIESNNPNILVVDTQPKGVYDRGHIKGAVNFPWAMDIKSFGSLPRDRMLILYCDCGHSEESINFTGQQMGESDACSSDDDATDVAKQLMGKFGFKDIKVLEGGWSDWQQLGYPIDNK
jgi:rhodanese-related sulfurtransferase